MKLITTSSIVAAVTAFASLTTPSVAQAGTTEKQVLITVPASALSTLTFTAIDVTARPNSKLYGGIELGVNAVLSASMFYLAATIDISEERDPDNGVNWMAAGMGAANALLAVHGTYLVIKAGQGAHACSRVPRRQRARRGHADRRQRRPRDGTGRDARRHVLAACSEISTLQAPWLVYEACDGEPTNRSAGSAPCGELFAPHRGTARSDHRAPAGRAVTGSAVAAQVKDAHQFDWKLRITDPAFNARQVPTSQPSGEVSIGFDRWRCEYLIEHDPTAATLRDESGYVTCVLARTGAQMQTMTLCQETDSKPSDRGTSTLRISDAAGQMHSLDLSCKSKSTDDWGPSVVELPVGAPGPAGPNVGGGAAPTSTSAQGRMPGKAVRVRDVNGALHFQWKLDVGDPAGTSRTLSPDGTSGPLAIGLQGWTCSYRIAQQQDPIFPQLEIGHVTCKSSSDDKAEAVMLCAENPERPSACNMSSLVITDDAHQRHTVIMSCKGATNPCHL